MYKLLVVDDEPQILEGVKCMLDWKRYGVERIEMALTYQEAIDKAVAVDPDIGLINELNTLHFRTRYLVMSGYNRFEYAQEALRSGAEDYLLKPVEREKLRLAVKKIIVRDLHGTLEEPEDGAPENDPVLGVPRGSFSTLTGRVLKLVREEYGQDISLKSIAGRFRMNSAYLGQVFLKETKMKFSRYLLSYRMLRARELILTQDDKISCVAGAVGFPDANHFYQQFRGYFNQSPLEMRNSGARKK